MSWEDSFRRRRLVVASDIRPEFQEHDYRARNNRVGREWREAIKRFSGDPKLASGYLPVARTILGGLIQQLRLGGIEYGHRIVNLPDGAVIRVIHNSGINVVEIDVSVPTSKTGLPNKQQHGFTFYPKSDSAKFGWLFVSEQITKAENTPWHGGGYSLGSLTYDDEKLKITVSSFTPFMSGNQFFFYEKDVYSFWHSSRGDLCLLSYKSPVTPKPQYYPYLVIDKYYASLAWIDSDEKIRGVPSVVYKNGSPIYAFGVYVLGFAIHQKSGLAYAVHTPNFRTIYFEDTEQRQLLSKKFYDDAIGNQNYRCLAHKMYISKDGTVAATIVYYIDVAKIYEYKIEGSKETGLSVTESSVTEFYLDRVIQQTRTVTPQTGEYPQRPISNGGSGFYFHRTVSGVSKPQCQATSPVPADTSGNLLSEIIGINNTTYTGEVPVALYFNDNQVVPVTMTVEQTYRRTETQRNNLSVRFFYLKVDEWTSDCYGPDTQVNTKMYMLNEEIINTNTEDILEENNYQAILNFGDNLYVDNINTKYAVTCTESSDRKTDRTPYTYEAMNRVVYDISNVTTSNYFLFADFSKNIIIRNESAYNDSVKGENKELLYGHYNNYGVFLTFTVVTATGNKALSAGRTLSNNDTELASIAQSMTDTVSYNYSGAIPRYDEFGDIIDVAHETGYWGLGLTAGATMITSDINKTESITQNIHEPLIHAISYCVDERGKTTPFIMDGKFCFADEPNAPDILTAQKDQWEQVYYFHESSFGDIVSKLPLLPVDDTTTLHPIGLY